MHAQNQEKGLTIRIAKKKNVVTILYCVLMCIILANVLFVLGPSEIFIGVGIFRFYSTTTTTLLYRITILNYIPSAGLWISVFIMLIV